MKQKIFITLNIIIPTTIICNLFGFMPLHFFKAMFFAFSLAIIIEVIYNFIGKTTKETVHYFDVKFRSETWHRKSIPYFSEGNWREWNIYDWEIKPESIDELSRENFIQMRKNNWTDKPKPRN